MSELADLVSGAGGGLRRPAQASASLNAGTDVAVIGAGPAGLAAAALVARAGFRTVLIDENASPGGQIHRGIAGAPEAWRALLGPDYREGERLLREFEHSGAAFEPATTVWSLDDRLELGLLRDGQARMLEARRVIVATGALERAFPVPDWTLPGVMTVGAAQTLLKASGMIADGQVVIAGCGPLVWLFAAQTLRAGGRIAALLDTTAPGAIRRGWVHAPGFIASPLFGKGVALIREVAARIPVIRGVVNLVAEGGDRLQRVRWRRANGAHGSIEAEHLLLHQGVIPNVNLALAAGVRHEWDDAQCCWRAVLDVFGRSSVPGIALAGDGARIGGAGIAEASGRLAAIGVVRDLAGPLSAAASDASEREARAALRRHAAGRAFLDRVFSPGERFRLPEGDTIVCRCEEVSAAQIRAAVALGCDGPNQMKTFLRCGMGPCQGRLCGLTVTELIACERGVPPAQVGYFRLRPPVKPVPLSALAALPADEAAVRAVARG